MKNAIKVLVLILLVTVIANSYGQNNRDGRWIVIAEKMVDFRADRDIVTPVGDEKNVDVIKLKCVKGTLKFKRVVVHMTDGSKKEFESLGAGVLTDGMSSLPFVLPGRDSRIKFIELVYDSVGGVGLNQRAKVEVLGRVVE